MLEARALAVLKQFEAALACRLTNICSHASARVAIQVGGAAVFARFGRADEAEADSGGFQNEIRGGLDPIESFSGWIRGTDAGGCRTA